VQNYNARWHKLWFSLLIRAKGKRFRPNPTQAPIVDHFVSGGRFILICGGERAGKSLTTAAIAGLDMGPRTELGLDEPQRRYWIIGPDYRQARPEFQYIYDALKEGGMVEKASLPQNETSPWSMLTKWNTLIETRSSSDVMKLASFTVDGVVIAEAAQQPEEVFRRARGRVAETRGWVILVGTLEESLPWYEDKLRAWSGPNPDGGISYSIPMWSNIDVFPRGINDPEIISLTQSLPPDYVSRRYGAEAVRHSDLVVPEFEFRSHVRSLPLFPDVPVELAIDPGKHAYAVVFLQHVGAFTYVHDCLYFRGEIAQSVIPQVMQHPLWERVNKEPLTSLIDIAGQHDTMGGKSQSKLWRDISGLELASKYWKENETISALRFRMRVDPVLGEPLVLFSDKMRTGVDHSGQSTTMLSEFDLWRWQKWSLTSDEKMRPIDNNNHALKALGYKLLYHYGIERMPRADSKKNAVRRKSWIPSSNRYAY
jgi:hypothetical protein